MKQRDLVVERVSIDAILPYARNARTHSAEQIAQVAASIREFGWTNPILIDDAGTIIAGHARLAAARQLGLDQVPIIRIGDLTDGQRRALILADNKLAMNAGWDEKMLALELGELADFSELTGFSENEIARILDGEISGATDPDDVPETPAEPVTRPGDIWCLGQHRIICGDATEAETVKALLAGVVPHLMVTDPPYGANYDPAWRNRAIRSSTGKSVGARAIGIVANDDRADWTEAWALFPGDVAYVWHAGLFGGLVAASLESAGFVMRNQIVWVKNQLVISRGDYHSQHEPCWYAVRKTKRGHWTGDRKQSTIWDIPKMTKSATGHSTQKPVECMHRPMANNSSIGQAVYDPFLGSGTSLIAAEGCDRICYGIEINPAYVDVAVLRWQAFAEASAFTEAGETFAAVAARRASETVAAEADLVAQPAIEQPKSRKAKTKTAA